MVLMDKISQAFLCCEGMLNSYFFYNMLLLMGYLSTLGRLDIYGITIAV